MHSLGPTTRIDHPDRLRVLRDTALLDTPSEEGFDRITRIASQALRAPVAVVALLDDERQFFKSSIGLPPQLLTEREMPLFPGSFCLQIAERNAPLVLSEVTTTNPILNALGGQAFMGVPLRTEEGWVLGALCVVDTKPRVWSDEEIHLLTDLAATVMTEIELRRRAQAERRHCYAAELAQREADAERERYLQLVNDLDGIAWEANAEDWQFTFVSRKAEEILGYPLEQWLGIADFWYRILHPDDYERVATLSAQDIGTQEHLHVEYRLIAADGRVVWLRDMMRVIPDAAGKPDRIRGLVLDITAQKEAQAALAASEARFRTLFDQAAVGMAVADLHGRPVHTNRALQQWLGYSAQELASMPFGQFSHPDGLHQEQLYFQELVTGQRDAYQIEKRYFRKDGKVVWGRLVASAVRNEHREVQFTVGMVEDITERKRAEVRSAAFQNMGQQLNTATTPQAAARVVLEVADELSGWDCCWLELVELERETGVLVLAMDLVDGARIDVTPGDPITAIGRYTRQALADGPMLLLRDPAAMPKPGDPNHLFFGDKNRPSASLLCVPIRSGSLVVGALSIQSYSFNAYGPEDLSTLQALADYCAGALERTRAEAAQRDLQHQLVQAQRMEAVGRLAGGVAHDFNNMLAVINGYSELVLMGQNTPPSVRGPVEEIRKAGERATTLTRQLLAFSRRQIIQPQVLHLCEVVDNIQLMLRRLIGEDIELVTSFPGSLGQVKADPSQIEQVLLNLVVNARDAMPRGGRLRLGLRNADLETTRGKDGEEIAAGAYVELEVSDTGCGMDAQTVNQIFEPFFTTKEVGQGTGLGLATVYGIVKQNQGHIEVESAPGLGSTFRVYLPRLEPVDPPPFGRLEAPQLPAGTETVLVVEDEEMLRVLVAGILRLHGYQVLEAAHATAALQRCQEANGAIHLLLTDVVMPGGGGHELAAAALRLQPELKVIFMSGYTDDAVVRHGVSSAEAHFIQKPFVAADLARKVREVLDQPQPVSAV